MSPAGSLGLGFHGAMLDGGLPLPAACKRLEAGSSLCLRPQALARLPRPVDHLSLHLARAPFCEPAAVQDAFLDHLAARLPPEVASVGVHLCGPYNQDMGRFGLGTGFSPVDARGGLPRRFMARASERLARPLLIENASFYHPTAADALAALRYANELARNHGTALIADLAHLAVNALNLRVDPRVLLGAVDWSLVEVVHTSGVSVDRRGGAHDGHGLPVHERVWALLEEARSLVERPTTFVLEHTDESWRGRHEAFDADWRRLGDVVVADRPATRTIDPEAAGVGYMAAIVLPRHAPALHAALPRDAWRALVEEWAADYLPRARSVTGAYFCLRPEERFPAASFVDPVDDFVRYVENFGEETPS